MFFAPTELQEGVVCPPLSPGNILKKRPLLKPPLFFPFSFCSCEMLLISVSFSWFMCFGGWAGVGGKTGGNEGGMDLRTRGGAPGHTPVPVGVGR